MCHIMRQIEIHATGKLFGVTLQVGPGVKSVLADRLGISVFLIGVMDVIAIIHVGVDVSSEFHQLFRLCIFVVIYS